MRKAFSILVLAALGTVLAVPPLAAQRAKDGNDRRVVVINSRSSPLVRLYGARTATSEWEENILTQPIQPGSRIQINFDDGTGSCVFDLRAVFKDKRVAQTWNFNVCSESEWYLVD
jgi:hypothetical protein